MGHALTDSETDQSPEPPAGPPPAEPEPAVHDPDDAALSGIRRLLGLPLGGILLAVALLLTVLEFAVLWQIP
ncbi:hypothetical protein AMIS_79360 [Actinoplanes missouriensis 431]|uniref:Uncharacterized protein n=1 Tax=Actinoplanes missouriensis (strain ATCC 14538 / DSM 43046 / CBS 188.64 / JCM 3121 / NBRC 102363 / NCIMB 12654 / NRRL B-3342 / UNCC 431) TaxID=512565 RepID=I0HJG9_ACTM4|nr:hypothetical protein [Actinoplanes missouriensis]BAL93156.1 hypothetical protein AMIS_79360 [Actinoplanes missouriensis 431]